MHQGERHASRSAPLSLASIKSAVHRSSDVAGGGEHGAQSREKIRMVGNGGPITGCLIHIVTQYSGFQDACVIFSFRVLPFRKIVIIQIGLI